MKGLAWISCLLGIWAAVAPFLFPWEVCTWVYLASVIPGVLVALLSGGFALQAKKSLGWLCWLCVALGLWLIVAPFFAGYALVLDVAWSNFVPGALIAVLSGAAGMMVQRAE